MPQIKLTFEKGLNADVSPFELGDGFVSACDNVRFPGAGAERIGGGGLVATFAGAPGWAEVLETATNHHVVALGAATTAGARVAYKHTIGGATAEITRYSEGGTIANMTAAGTTVTVNDVLHGLTTGDIVSVWGCVPSTYNVESASITVTGVNNFTYTVPVAPAVTPATTFGLYSYGTTRSTYTTYGDEATGGDYGGVLIVNLPDDGIYYWTGTSIPMRKLVPGSTETAEVARPFGRFIVRLGVTTGGTLYPYRISWSDPAEPGSLPTTFTSAIGNQAGFVDKPEIGQLIDCLPMGDDLIVYGTKGRLVMRYIDGNDVFQFTKLPGEEGLYSKGCVVDTQMGHVFLSTARHVLAHTGGAVKDISQGRVQSLLTGAEGTNFRLATHPNRPEVWVMYRADVGGILPDIPAESLIWNWEMDTWGKSTFGGWSAVSVGATFYVLSGNNLSTLDDNTQNHNFTMTLERQGITAGDASLVKNLQGSTPYIDTNATWYANPIITVEHGSSMAADTAATYATGVSYTIGSTKPVDARATGGKFLAWAISIGSTLANADAGYYNIKLRSVDLNFTAGGKR